MGSVSLKEYYNKLVQVQTSLKIARALHTEIYHHLNNGAAVLHGAIRKKRKIRDISVENAFLNAAHRIADDVGALAHDVMLPVQIDAVSLNVDDTHLTSLLDDPAQMTRENFDALSAFNDRLHTVDETFRAMRIESEVKLLRTSGLVPIGFDLNSKGEAFSDYYNTLVEVQLSVKVARALEDEMRFHFGALKETAALMEPVVEGTLRLNITSTRLVDLVLNPTVLSEEDYDSLAAFNDRLNKTNNKFRHLRAECELKRLLEQGKISPDFKL